MGGDDFVRTKTYQIATPTLARQVSNLQHFNLMAILVNAMNLSLIGTNIVIDHSDLAVDVAFII